MKKITKYNITAVTFLLIAIFTAGQDQPTNEGLFLAVLSLIICFCFILLGEKEKSENSANK